jgi:hypothetical protein
MLLNNLHSSDKDNQSLNEGNFISKDFTGLIDSDASSKLSGLTISKLFEGLDIENNDKMHRFISTNSPALQNVMGYDKSDDIFAVEIIKEQMNYIAEKISFIEKDFDKYYNYIISAYKTEQEDKIEGAVAGFTSPEGFSSIIPTIEEMVKEVKEGGVDFTNASKLESFNTLHRIKVSNIINEISKTLEESSYTFGIVNLYKKIDAMPLEEIKSDYAVFNPDIYIAQSINLEELYTSDDPIARISAFYEESLNFYPFIKQLKRNFNETYDVITEGDLVRAAIHQFVPRMDYSPFSDITDLLNKVCGLLVNRVYVSSPDEDNKNITIPALQAIYVGLLAIVSTKLINYNIKVQATITQKAEDKKKEIAKTAEDRVRNAYNSYKLLIDHGFFTPGSGVYKEGGLNMNPEVIKNIHYFLHSIKLLPDEKMDSDVYDRTTADAVIKFQTINKAQKIDGKIGSETKAIMDKTANFLANKYNII